MTRESHVTFYFDVGSPYSYLAATQVPGLSAETGVPFVYRPVLLGGVFKASGNDMPARVAAKARYMLHDLARWASHYEVPFRMSSRFPANTILVQRVLTAMVDAEDPRLPEATLALFRAMWADDRDVTDPAVVAEVLASLALDAEHWLTAAGSQPVKDRLRVLTDEAVARGMFGAPAFVLGDDLYWGNDRLDLLRHRLLADKPAK